MDGVEREVEDGSKTRSGEKDFRLHVRLPSLIWFYHSGSTTCSRIIFFSSYENRVGN